MVTSPPAQSNLCPSEGIGGLDKTVIRTVRLTFFDAEAGPPSLDALQGRGQSILVVDDVADQRMIACGILRKLGYAASAVASGEEALAYLEDHTVDLMVIDMIMDPGMNGLDTFRAVRRIRPQQKAIIASGFAETGSVTTALQAGVGAYIRKPYSLEQIGRPVKEALEQSPGTKTFKPSV